MKKQLRAFIGVLVTLSVVALIVRLFGQSVLTYVGLFLCVALTIVVVVVCGFLFSSKDE